MEHKDEPEFKNIEIHLGNESVIIKINDRGIVLNYSDAKFLADSILETIPKDKP